MSNIRVDVGYTIQDGSEIKFRSPVDCSAITGLIVYYPGSNGNITSKVFAFADAHGNNVGDIDHLFAENVVVKVILDVTTGMAFVQNADTNAYLEAQLASKAPAGYGLGTKLTEITHIDNADKNGFYLVTGAVASGHPFDYGAANILVVGGSADLMPTQIGFGISMNPTTNNAMAIRAADGIWEWFNPPMKVGVEYRTTERWNGKPVYAKCVDFGTLPNTEEKMVYHGIYGLDNIIYASATAWVGNEVMIINSNTYYINDFRAAQNVVAIRTNADLTSWTDCVFTLKYTKN